MSKKKLDRLGNELCVKFREAKPVMIKKLETPPIRLGLCCINTTLKAQKPCNNLLDLERMIKWNEENNIKVFRLTSGLFPYMSNPKLQKLLNLEISYSLF